MAKEMLKIGDLVKWGVPGVDKSPIHAMVIDYWDGRDGDPKFWMAMRGDGTKWKLYRVNAPTRGRQCYPSSRGSWWGIEGDRFVCATSSVLV